MKLKKLEAIRGFVALYIVLHHFILFNQLYKSYELPQLVVRFFMFPGEAVLAFFMLSGFVIYLSVNRHAGISFGEYFKRRFIRIYPILICTFVLSTVVFGLNNLVGSQLFGHQFSGDDLTTLGGNVLMLQDIDIQPGIIVLPYLKNFPLWSLSYEWWYYMAFFPLFLYFSEKRVKYSVYHILLIVLAGWGLFLVYPSHIFLVVAYFLLWWAGAECARVYLATGTFNFKQLQPVLISVAIMCTAIAVPIAKSYFVDHKTYTQINARYPITAYLHNYAACLIFLLLGCAWWRFKLIGFSTLLGPFRKLAPISFALYLVHFPILWFDLSFIHNAFVVVIIKLLLIFGTAYLLEMKMQPAINKYLFKTKV